MIGAAILKINGIATYSSWLSIFNRRSIKLNAMAIKHYVVNNNVDILALTATWLRPGNCDDLKVGVLCPGAYSFHHAPGIHGI